MTKITTFRPGFIGISRGDLSLNAVVIDTHGEPCFFEVTSDQAERICAWATRTSAFSIQDLLPDLSADERELLMTGICPEEWDALTKADEGQGTFQFLLDDVMGFGR